jgi:hypothetical protein
VPAGGVFFDGTPSAQWPRRRWSDGVCGRRNSAQVLKPLSGSEACGRQPGPYRSY